MEMEMIHKLRKKLCKQLEGYVDIQTLGGNALEDVTNLVRTIKNLDMIADHDEMGTSQRGQFMGSYNDASYRRGRDSMGRFVSREGDGGASMRGSYHDDTREMVDKLRQMMSQTNDPMVKSALNDAANHIGGMM